MKQFILERTEFRLALKDWFQRHGRQLPWRETQDPYRVLVSELMLQQTQVAAVLPYYLRWLERFPTVTDLARADEAEVLRAWEGLGYYSRARNLHQCAKIIVDQRNAVFPSSVDELMTLPGVGRYTAGAVRSFAFNLAAPIVDGNVARVLSRILNIQTPIDEASGKALLWEAAENYAAADHPRLLNSALMELGALICLPRKPLCVICPIRSFCRAIDPESLPKKRDRPQIEVRKEAYFWSIRNHAILLAHNRGKRWRGLWTLPKLADPGARRPEITVIHPVTRFLIHLEVYRLDPPATFELDQKWIRFDSLPDLPMPSPHRRAIKILIEKDPDFKKA
jgi:A/G-specific adenine glycosylase